MLRNKIIVALDYSEPKVALNKAEELIDHIYIFKVGYELFFNGGNDVIKSLIGLGAEVFLDLKLSDIPNTMKKGVDALSKLDVKMLSIHASSGRESIRSAVDAKKNMMIFGVTALTSFNFLNFQEVYGSENIEERVGGLTEILNDENADGVICSPYEVKAINQRFPNLKTITPGIRPLWSEKNDQSRFMTPSQAIKEGSDYLVIGRPITFPPKFIGSSVNAVDLIVKEINHSIL